MQFLRTLSLAAAAAIAAATFSMPAKAGGGDVLLGGVAGFAVGTLFGNATAQPRYYYAEPVYVAPPPPAYRPAMAYYYSPEPWSPEWYSYCARKYASFEPRSGTFLGFDGYRHLCQ
jgi:BA14K-like protein